MPVLVEHVSKRSMNFANQRKAYLLRQVHGMPYEDIAKKVVNLQGKKPSKEHVRSVCNEFSVKKSCRPYHYKKSGRRPWKLTNDVQKFVLKRLLADRAHQVVTSSGLAAEVAKAKGVVLEASCIRKFLQKQGYRWLPRRQKRKYSRGECATRKAWCEAVLRLSKADLRHKLAMSMDGVVISMPPTTEVERINFCWGGVTHMWRKPGESNCPKLAGANDYEKQVPISRSIPLWGGLSEGGFAPVLWHLHRKKVTKEMWAKAIRDGLLVNALKAINPRDHGKPWTVLCDNETFLRANVCKEAYASQGIRLWGVPPKSPDLNPVELFWSWVRRKLRDMDLLDLRKKGSL